MPFSIRLKPEITKCALCRRAFWQYLMVCSICLSRPTFFLHTRIIFFLRWIFSGSPIIKMNWSDTSDTVSVAYGQHVKAALTSICLLNDLLSWKWCHADYYQYALSLLRAKKLLNSVKSFDLINEFCISSKYEWWCSTKSHKAAISVSNQYL